MTDLFNLISSISGAPAPAAPPVRQTQAGNAPKPAPRPVGATNGAPQPPSLKRKAEGLPAGNQVKIQRKDTPPVDRASAAGRPAAASDAAKPKPATVPYRGTAGGGGSTAKPSLMTKKPTVATSSATTLLKPASAGPLRSPGSAPTSATSAAPKKGSYAEMLAKAKQAQQSKPPTPPIKNEPTKILTKKERLALKAEAKEGARSKKLGVSGPPKTADSKGAIGKEKVRKPVETGYQGTARPAKKPVEVGYKGTAKPATAAGSSGLAGRTARHEAPKSKSKQPTPDSWIEDDLGEDEEEQEDYYSDESDDMEGGVWDVYEEEERALKTAKREDAEHLREELDAKRAKDERKRKLLAMNRAAGAKKKY